MELSTNKRNAATNSGSLRHRHRLIFVVGNPRSGTTMMGHILGQNKSVNTFKELHFFEKLWDAENEKKKLTQDEALSLTANLINIDHSGFYLRENSDEFNKMALEVLSRVKPENYYPSAIYTNFLEYFTVQKNKTISCEQTPGYLYFIEEIKKLFPGSKFIYMIRDPRDVILSKKNRWKRRSLSVNKIPFYTTIRDWFNYSPIFTSFLWKAAARYSLRFKDDPSFLIVRYEDVLKYSEKELKKVSDFVNIQYSPSMLEVPLFGSSLTQDRMGNKGIDKKRTQNWKRGGLNQAEIFISQKITSNYMIKFGYTSQRVIPNVFLIFGYIIIAPIKLIFSFLLHKRYFLNIIEPVRRRLGLSQH